MNLSSSISIVVVLMGAVLMVLAVRGTGRVLARLQDRAHSRPWRILRALMLAFVGAYAAAALVIALGLTQVLVALTGLVFAGGALFVFVVVRSSDATIGELDDASVSRDYLESILDAMGDALMVVDRDGVIVTCNRALAGWLGNPRDELLGTRVGRYVDLAPERLTDFLAGGEHVRIKTRLKTAWGMRVPISMSRARPEGFDGIVCIAQDISDQLRAEQELQSARALADGKTAAVSRYLSVVRAELKGVLAQLESRETSRPDAAELVALARTIIGDIDELSRDPREPRRVHPRAFNVRAGVERTVDAARAAAAARGVALELSIDRAVPVSVTSGQHSLHRALFTVLFDMSQWSEPGVVVISVNRLSTSREASELLFEVRGVVTPRGAGASHVGRRDVGVRTLARGLVLALGGKIWKQRRGSDLSVFFTLTDLAASVPEQANALGTLSGAGVWIVGADEHENHGLAESATDMGMSARVFSSGELALRTLDEARPDVIIVDGRTSDLRGVEFLRRAEDKLDGRSMPMALLGTAVKTSVRDERSGLAALLQKPVRRAELEEVLLELLDGREQVRDAAPTPRRERERPGVTLTELSPERDHDPAAITRLAGRVAEFLVVDDNSINRRLLACYLEQEGHSSTLAASGREALALLTRRSFDVVLLDLMMPELDGFEVLTWIRSRPALADMPVLMISAVDDIESIARCVEAGADDFLPKPFNPSLLRARIESCLERQRRKREERTYLASLEKASNRSDRLLRVLLPDPIVEEYMATRRIRPRRYDDVAVMFVDIVGFTSYCDQHSPEEVLDRLQELIREFERLVRRHGAQKIKTIGDAFMASAGLLYPAENPVLTCTNLGREMLAAVRELAPDWEIRIGVHVGPVVGGVVGDRHYQFDIWGDTVNTAQRIEHHGVPGSVCLSRDAWDLVAGYYTSERLDPVTVKGKGTLEVYRVSEPRSALARDLQSASGSRPRLRQSEVAVA